MAVGILVILISAIATVSLVLLLSSPEQIQFQWGISVGDEFLFDIEVEGSMNNESNPVPFMAFDGTRIHVAITHLPNVSLLDSEEEVVEVIRSTKVHCRFANGTELPPDSREGFYTSSSASFSDIVSRVVLPVGGWGFVDNLYPDDLASDRATGADSDTFYSWIDQETIFFGYRHWYIDFGHGWDADLNPDTGFPISIRHWESDNICIGYYGVTLTVVSQ